MDDAHRIPRIPAELIPMLDSLIERSEEHVPHHHSPQELSQMRDLLPWVADEFGYRSELYYRALLVTALEHARAEVLPA